MGKENSLQVYDIHNTAVQLIMVIKMQQLIREELPSLTYANLEDYLDQDLWQNELPHTLNQACDQIMHVNADDIVRYLSREAIYTGKKENLSDFTDVIGGN